MPRTAARRPLGKLSLVTDVSCWELWAVPTVPRLVPFRRFEAIFGPKGFVCEPIRLPECSGTV